MAACKGMIFSISWRKKKASCAAFISRSQLKRMYKLYFLWFYCWLLQSIKSTLMHLIIFIFFHFEFLRLSFANSIVQLSAHVIIPPESIIHLHAVLLGWSCIGLTRCPIGITFSSSPWIQICQTSVPYPDAFIDNVISSGPKEINCNQS